MSQFCQLLKNGNIVVAVAITKIILQCSSSLHTAHKFELRNEYEATAMPDTSLEIKACCQLLISPCDMH